MSSGESSSGTRSTEAHPRLLREGEVSPFKILLTILLRENYTHVEVKSHKAADRIALGGFFYKLISVRITNWHGSIVLCTYSHISTYVVIVVLQKILRQD
jgi:hypothetical protein